MRIFLLRKISFLHWSGIVISPHEYVKVEIIVLKFVHNNLVNLHKCLDKNNTSHQFWTIFFCKISRFQTYVIVMMVINLIMFNWQ